MITAHPVEAVFALAHKVTPAKVVALVRAMEQELIFLESILHTALLVLFLERNLICRPFSVGLNIDLLL